MSLKKALNKLVNMEAPIVRGFVLSVDKNAYTCNVQLVNNDGELNNVKLKPMINSGDPSILGLVIFPAINSIVTVCQVNGDNNDTVVVEYSQIESISLDTATALKLLLASDGTMGLNTTKLTFNNGNNGGIPLVNPLASVILKLQQKVNQLITVFNTHVHPVVGSATSPTATPGPALTAPLIKSTDIANKTILQ